MGCYHRSAFRIIPNLAFLYCLFSSQTLFALPDPRDSVIIESKTIIGETSSVYVRVYITNKDTLAGYSFAFLERSLSGGAYLVLAQPRTFANAIRPLDSTLQFLKVLGTAWYNGIPPDTIPIGGFYNPNEPSTW